MFAHQYLQGIISLITKARFWPFWCESTVQAIPRTLWLDNQVGDNLIQAPVEELKLLRGAKSSMEEVELEAGSIIKVEGSSGGQVRPRTLLCMQWFKIDDAL